MECAAYASLLALLIHAEYDVLMFPRLSSLDVLQGQPCTREEGLQSFLSRSLFSGYVIKIFEKQTPEGFSLGKSALKPLDIEIVRKTNSHEEFVF